MDHLPDASRLNCLTRGWMYVFALLALAQQVMAAAAPLGKPRAAAPAVGGQTPVEWRFAGQKDNRVTLRIAAASDGSSYTAALRWNAFVALPPRAQLSCATPDSSATVRVYPPEPLRDVAMARVEVPPDIENCPHDRFQERLVVFQITGVPEPPRDGSSTARNKDGKSRFDPAFSFDRVIDAVAINSPVPAEYHRPDLAVPDDRLSAGAWAFPPDCLDAVEIDLLPGAGEVTIPVSDLAKFYGWTHHTRGDLSSVRLWNEGSPLAFSVSRKPIDGGAFIVFAAPKAGPFYRGSRVYATFGSTSGTVTSAANAPLAQPSGGQVAARFRPRSIRLVRRPDLDTRPRAADYLVITIPMFHEPLRPLLNLRRAQGYRVEVVDVDDIYLCYGAGMPRPTAIRAFVANAFRHWEAPAPTYLTLVGDASTRFDEETTTLAANQVPSFYRGDPADPGIPAGDSGFCSFLGRGYYPAMITGRLAVREPAEARAVAEKIVAYEMRPELGPWRARALWMLDSGYEHLFSPRAATAPKPLAVRRLEVMDYPFMDHYRLSADMIRVNEGKVSPPCNYDMMGRLSDGCLAMHFAGHGGVTLLSKQKVFFQEDVARLRNGMRLPFCTQVSCHTGCFDFPIRRYSASIAELMLRKPDGGAIGVFAASRTIGGDEFSLQSSMFRALYRRPQTTLGMAAGEAKIRLIMAQGGWRPFSDSYNLLADPATVFTLPPADLALSVKPPLPIEAPGPALVEVSYSLPARLRLPATVWLTLTDEKGREYDSKTIAVKNAAEASGSDETLRVPAGAAPARLNVAGYAASRPAYAASRAKGMESAGIISAPVAPMKVREKPASTGARLAFLRDSVRVSGRDEKTGAPLVDGETVFFDVRLVNTGLLASSTASVTLVHRRFGQPAAAALAVAREIVAPLASGEIRPVRLRWDEYNTLGRHLFELRLEGRNAVAPQTTGIIPVEIKGKPDLRIPAESVEVHRNGRRLRVAFVIANDGATTAGPTTAQVACLDDQGTTVPLSKPIPTPSIGAGRSCAVGPVDVTLPTDKPMTIVVRADIYQDYSETNEDNNVAVVRLGTKGKD